MRLFLKKQAFWRFFSPCKFALFVNMKNVIDKKYLILYVCDIKAHLHESAFAWNRLHK